MMAILSNGAVSSPQPAGPPPTATPGDPYEPTMDEQIRRRAREIWESTGQPQGRDEINWQIATDEVRGG